MKIFGSETKLLRDANRDGFGKEFGIADQCVPFYYFSTFVSAYNFMNFLSLKYGMNNSNDTRTQRLWVKIIQQI